MYNIEAKKRINSKKFTPIKEFETESEIIEYVKEKELTIHIPYSFTHIQLSNGQIITQHDNHFGLMCSPQKLVGMMQSQGILIN